MGALGAHQTKRHITRTTNTMSPCKSNLIRMLVMQMLNEVLKWCNEPYYVFWGLKEDLCVRGQHINRQIFVRHASKGWNASLMCLAYTCYWDVNLFTRCGYLCVCEIKLKLVLVMVCGRGCRNCMVGEIL